MPRNPGAEVQEGRATRRDTIHASPATLDSDPRSEPRTPNAHMTALFRSPRNHRALSAPAKEKASWRLELTEYRGPARVCPAEAPTGMVRPQDSLRPSRATWTRTAAPALPPVRVRDLQAGARPRRRRRRPAARPGRKSAEEAGPPRGRKVAAARPGMGAGGRAPGGRFLRRVACALVPAAQLTRPAHLKVRMAPFRASARTSPSGPAGPLCCGGFGFHR